MKLEIFAIYDSAVSAYMQPFFARSRGDAMRQFSDAVNDGKSPFFSHPTDYTLFVCGSWDDGGGIFDTSPPERVASAMDVKFKE